jgi:hypothetical protein
VGADEQPEIMTTIAVKRKAFIIHLPMFNLSKEQ